MPIVKTKLDDAAYKRLVTKRKELGLPSVSALFLKKCGELTEDFEANEIVRRALLIARRKPSGTKFLLRDLFNNEDWNKFSKGSRLRAGKMFFDKVSSAVHGIRAEKKSSGNHQIYAVA